MNKPTLARTRPPDAPSFDPVENRIPPVLATPAWLLAIALAYVLLGLLGFSGSSSLGLMHGDPLLEPEIRSRPAEVVGRSRAVRSDEFAVEMPLERSQQLAVPSFPLVNARVGLGHLQRNPGEIPVLDWGLAFRPLSWPLLAGTRWSLGVRWFLRTALTLLGTFGWMRAICSRPLDVRARRRRSALLGACAVAVLYSSALSWWMSTSLTPLLGLTGLGIAAVERCRAAASMWRRAGWFLAAGWLFVCAFFVFYPPAWAPTLWIACAALFDLHWHGKRTLRGAALGAAPYVALLAVGVTLSILYYAPYLVVVRDTLYPGNRVALPGGFGLDRLLDLTWPSMLMVGAAARPEQYLGGIPGWNVCEASSVEVLPLVPLLALALVSRRVRSALWRAIAGAPMTLCALAVLAAWVFVPRLPAGCLSFAIAKARVGARARNPEFAW